MKKIWTLSLILVGISILAFAGNVYASESGSKGYSQTGCTCHGAASPQATVTTTGIPDQYVPGDTYLLTVSVISTTVSGDSGGFDLSVTTGTLSATDPNVQIVNDEAIHKNNNARSWQVNWTAPAEVGPVNFHVTGLASDGTGVGGDEYATNSYSITPEDARTEERFQLWTIQISIGSMMIIFTSLFAMGIASARASKEEKKVE